MPHQVGVLPEPERGSNGYRSYELAHVARLLRIRTFAELRTTRARPDLTPVLVEFLEAVGAAEPSDLEQDASILVARLFEADGSPDDLRDLATVLRGVHEDPRYVEFVDRFERLAPDAPDDEVREVAENFIAAFGPALTRVVDSTMGGRLRQLRTQDVPAIEVDPRLNDAQAEVLRLFGEAL